MLVNFIAHEYNLIGLIGVILVLAAYLLLQTEKMSANSFLYSFFNFLGSILILISLCYTWNLASFVIEAAWLLISMWGLVRYFIRTFSKSGR